MYFEQCGALGGIPVVFLHGGPGGSCGPDHRRFFNPEVYHIVLFDQRGCGQSLPRGFLFENNTQRLLEDIEHLRTELGIERWLVFGGSWGASLAVAYCAAHESSCLGAILRGTFLTGQEQFKWFSLEAGQLLPVAWNELLAAVPETVGSTPLSWLMENVQSSDQETAETAAKAWFAWESHLMGYGHICTPGLQVIEDLPKLIDKYRVQAHYLSQECFLGEANLLSKGATINNIPVTILHGCCDVICLPDASWKLHQKIKNSRLHFVPLAGHSAFDPPMVSALIQATDYFSVHRNFDEWIPAFE